VCSGELPLSEAIPNSAAGYMLETPSIRRYSFIVTPFGDDVTVSSENPSGAVNQQERPGPEEWTVGFVDGEGCFSISVVRNATCRSGWQVQHEFAVTQAARSRSALEILIEVFECGRLIENPRRDNHRETLLRFSVKRRDDLMRRVVPFFEERPLRTAKQLDFEKFAHVLRMMQDGAHLTQSGLRRIARITEQMNRRQRSRFLESSEAIRQPPRTTAR
jgi:LAGLIDADG endonuclease